MSETKAYKTYLGYAIGVTPPNKVRKFKKHASPKLTIVPLSPEKPTRKSKRVKRPAKKPTNAPTAGIVIRDTLVMSLYKKKEKNSLREFHKTHPSGSGIVTKIALSAIKIKPSVTNEGIGAKPEVLDVNEESTKSKAKSQGIDEDDSNNDHDSSSEGSDQESDSGDDNTQSDKEKGSDSEHETDENETGSDSDQKENEEEVEDEEEEKEDKSVKTPSNYTSVDDEDETNVESKVKNKAEDDEDKGMDYTTNQFDDDVDVRLNEPVNTDEGFIQKEGIDAEMINVKQENKNLEITLNQVIEDAHILIDKIDKSQLYLTATEHRECYDGLIKSYNLDKSLFSTYDKFYSLKRSRKDKDKDPSAGSDRGLKKRKTSKDAEPTKGPKTKDSKFGSSKGTKSQLKSSRKFVHVEEPEFEVANSDMPQDQEENLGNDDEEPKRKVASKHDWFTKPKHPQEPIDPDWIVGKTPQQGSTQS
nr:hypothetical protein [Tanacetum cinerariifolium]